MNPANPHESAAAQGVKREFFAPPADEQPSVIKLPLIRGDFGAVAVEDVDDDFAGVFQVQMERQFFREWIGSQVDQILATIF